MSTILKYTRNTRTLLPGTCRFIRSDVPARLSSGDIKWLIEHDVTTIIDLRDDNEREARPCPLRKRPEFQYYCMPVTGGNSIPGSPSQVPLSYINMMDDKMDAIIDLIRNAQSNVMYFCDAGKDRTGVVSALILREAGASEDYIVEDYMKSRDSLADALEDYAEEHPEIDLNVITPHPEYMREFLRLLKEKEGAGAGETAGPVIPLKIITDALEMANDEWNQYLDLKKMEVVSLPEYPFGGEYDEDDQELADLIEEEWNTRFFRMPSQYEIHKYRIMERFIWDLPEGSAQNTLDKAIRGRGAFRRFKDTLVRFGLLADWYSFEESVYREKAIEWCEEHGFSYSE